MRKLASPPPFPILYTVTNASRIIVTRYNLQVSLVIYNLISYITAVDSSQYSIFTVVIDTVLQYEYRVLRWIDQLSKRAFETIGVLGEPR